MRELVSLVIVAVLGLASGAFIGSAANQRSSAQTGCPIEQGTFSNGPDSASDNSDGVDEDNRWSMLGGRDFGRSLACNDGSSTDRFEGNGENDDLGGGSGNDIVDGNANNDMIFGGANFFGGADILSGGDGADTLTDVEPGDAETADGGSGNDNINVQDTDHNDIAIGGPGNDGCTADSGDQVNC